MTDRRYGIWAGNPNGIAEDPDRCVWAVLSRDAFSFEYQCGRKRGHGPADEYCKQHAKIMEAYKPHLGGD